MKHRGTEKKWVRPTLTLWVLYLLGSAAFAAKPNEPRRYNAGVTAYQSNDFTQAATAFENATASTDRALQERALYNLGNTNYRLGQEQPAQAQQLWHRAIKHYQSALALNPQDADAKFNQEFVKKKLEELKKQQQEQQQQQNQKSEKNQQDKNQEQNKDEQKNQEKKQDQQQQNAKDQQSEEQKQQQSQEEQKQKENQEQKDQQQQQQGQQEKSSPEEKKAEKGGTPENYDKMQATALLNDLRENERNWNFFPEVQMKDLKDSGEPAKDW